MQSGLRELYARLDLDALPQTILRFVNRLVPADISAYNEIDPTRRRLIGVFYPDETAAPTTAAIPDWERCMHQHPLVTHFRDNPNDSPRRISDFMRQADFEQTDLYRLVFMPLKSRYQVVTAMPVPAPLMAGIAQNRGKRNFSDRELELLDLLRPHLRQAYENACLVTSLTTEVARLRHTLDRMDRGVIAIDAALRVLQVSPAASRFLTLHLGRDALAGNALPDTLRRWAPAQIDALKQNQDGPTRPAPLMLDTPDGRLVIRLIADTQPDRFVIVIQHAAQLTDPKPLLSLGLTAREADVLFHCLDDKSRAEIGQRLNISERTVQKHLENLYNKLGVTTRVAAVTKALEWLRL
ncbi:MAG: LuxR C-terminal-related transcriptional regulator [Phycisphaerales bacterium]